MNKVKNDINEKRELNKIKNDIKQALETFCIEYEIENIKTETQNIFSAFWSFCGSLVFPCDFFVIGCQNNIKIYDLFLLDSVCDLYIFFCKLYNKICSISDFCELVRIDYNIIIEWNHNGKIDTLFTQEVEDLKKLYIMSIYSIDNYNVYINKMRTAKGEIITTLQTRIFYKLHSKREELIKNQLTSNKNPVALLSVVNKEYLWNVEQVKEEYKQKALLLSELPKLDILCKQDETNNV